MKVLLFNVISLQILKCRISLFYEALKFDLQNKREIVLVCASTTVDAKKKKYMYCRILQKNVIF